MTPLLSLLFTTSPSGFQFLDFLERATLSFDVRGKTPSMNDCSVLVEWVLFRLRTTR